jgi:hypothetical protein
MNISKHLQGSFECVSCAMIGRGETAMHKMTSTCSKCPALDLIEQTAVHDSLFTIVIYWLQLTLS